jgi:hypothetical protein
MHNTYTHNSVICLHLQEALKGLHWLPTLDCLALSPDPAIKARAAAALAALATAGQLQSQEAQIRWRDMLLGWLSTSTANLLLPSGSSSDGGGGGGGGGSSDGSSATAWLWKWFVEEDGVDGSKRVAGKVSAADEALARACVAALRGEWVSRCALSTPCSVLQLELVFFSFAFPVAVQGLLTEHPRCVLCRLPEGQVTVVWS